MTSVDSDQVPTKRTTMATIMGRPEFAKGFEDARKGVPFDWRIGGDPKNTNGAWSYERGRLLAHIAPLSMPLYIGSSLNPKAVALCNAAFDRKLIT
jgi:hypothetical protein